MKRKSLTMILCLLTCLSLVGVGFASWIITAGDEQSTSSNIEVDTVTDNRLVLTIAQNDAKIWFGGVTEDYQNPTNAWLIAGANTPNESLKVTYTCTVEKKSKEAFVVTDNVIQDLSLSGTFAAPKDNTAYNTAKTAGCFVEPSENATISNVSISENNVTVTFTITIEYKWGSAFGTNNPFTYYNSKKVDESVTVDGTQIQNYGDHAAYYLGLLDNIDKPAKGDTKVEIKYNLTVTANPSGTTSLK